MLIFCPQTSLLKASRSEAMLGFRAPACGRQVVCAQNL